MLITYTCIWTTVESYDMTASSAYMDQSEWRTVYTASGGDYNAHRIAYICQIATEIRSVEYLYLYMNNSKIIWHEGPSVYME
jgi:hypothetical protein